MWEEMNMTREEAEKYLFCAMSVGEQLLVSGAEVGRVEDTISRICIAYGAKKVDVFSITSTIITTMYVEDFVSCTQTRRVSNMNNDLRKVDDLNKLSRQICERQPDPEYILKELEDIKNGPKYSFESQMLLYALISGSFCMFFGGNTGDMLASAMTGILLKCLEAQIKKGAVNPLMTGFLCSVMGGLLSHFFVIAGIGYHEDLISIGNIMLFIPGIAFTNSLRDMFSGDTLTGILRFLESILLAIIIASGFAMVNFIL